MAVKNEKINNGTIKIFKLMSMLFDNNADYQSVIDVFKDEIDEQTKNNLQVVLNKNLNTLKVFGMKVNKEKRKYNLDSNLFAMELTSEDIKSLSILEKTCKNFPDKECCNNIQELIRHFKLRMSAEDRIAFENLTTNYNFSFYYADWRDQIEECKQACKSNLQYEITYRNNNNILKCKCVPKEVTYDSKSAYLKAYDTLKNQNLEIALPKILSLNSTNQIKNSKEMPTTIVFKVKNRLAKSYKLKENEHFRGEIDDEGCRVVVNTQEPIEKLKSRLLRYGNNCEIISPKFIRNDMLDTINDMLNNYE